MSNARGALARFFTQDSQLAVPEKPLFDRLLRVFTPGKFAVEHARNLW